MRVGVTKVTAMVVPKVVPMVSCSDCGGEDEEVNTPRISTRVRVKWLHSAAARNDSKHRRSKAQITSISHSKRLVVQYVRILS